jgi:hypothetical protein
MRFRKQCCVVVALACLALSAGLTAGCKTNTRMQSAFEDIEVGKLTPGWLKANRLAASSDFGYSYQQFEDRGNASVSQESYRVAVSHGRVLAKAYTFRRGWRGGGHDNVQLHYVLEAEVDVSAWRPAEGQWQPAPHGQALDTAAVAVAEAVPTRAYPGHVMPPQNFLDLRNLFFEEVEARAYGETLARAFSDDAVLPETADDLETEARRYRRQLNLIQREINVVQEQLVRLNYQYEFAENDQDRRRYGRLRDALDAKLIRLGQNRNQLDKLMQESATGQDRILLARWTQASRTASAQAAQAANSLRGNIPGWMLTHYELLPLLPGKPVPAESTWQDKTWSHLWPRMAFADILNQADWDKLLQPGQSQSFMTPHGVEVTLTCLPERRCRVEMRYRFYEYAGL